MSSISSTSQPGRRRFAIHREGALDVPVAAGRVELKLASRVAAARACIAGSRLQPPIRTRPLQLRPDRRVRPAARTGCSPAGAAWLGNSGTATTTSSRAASASIDPDCLGQHSRPAAWRHRSSARTSAGGSSRAARPGRRHTQRRARTSADQCGSRRRAVPHPCAGRPGERSPYRCRGPRRSARQIAIACGWTEVRQRSQMGRTVERSRGRLQTRQSEGNAVVTKSSRTERNAALVRPANPCSRRIPARPSSGLALEPGGAPGKPWSVLSFRLTLKMHLPTRRSRPLGPRRWSKYKSSRPDSPAGSLREPVPKDCVPRKSPPLIHSHRSQ